MSSPDFYQRSAAKVSVEAAIAYTASMRQVMASLIPVALTYEDPTEALEVIQEAMSA